MATSDSSPKLTPSLAFGVSLLGLQAATAPVLLAALAQTPLDGSPRWLVGLYIALELGAMVSAVTVAWGARARHDTARFAPAVILLPCWLATAMVGPFVYAGTGGIVFGLFALSVGAVTALPFLTASAKAFFAPRTATGTALGTPATQV